MDESSTSGKQPEGLKVSASELKNAWHEYLDHVRHVREPVIVTRYGRPVAKLVPYEAEDAAGSLFGYLAGTLSVHGDIVAPTGEAWEADA